MMKRPFHASTREREGDDSRHGNISEGCQMSWFSVQSPEDPAPSSPCLCPLKEGMVLCSSCSDATRLPVVCNSTRAFQSSHELLAYMYVLHTATTALFVRALQHAT